jgi:uncharacterized protein YlxP (DUF503 family)
VGVVVGVIIWELEVLGAQSLKDKRRVVKSVKERLQSRFRVSAAETNYQDLWQRAELAAAVVAGEQAQVTDVLDSMDRLVTGDVRARVISARRSYH